MLLLSGVFRNRCMIKRNTDFRNTWQAPQLPVQEFMAMTDYKPGFYGLNLCNCLFSIRLAGLQKAGWFLLLHVMYFYTNCFGQINRINWKLKKEAHIYRKSLNRPI